MEESNKRQIHMAARLRTGSHISSSPFERVRLNHCLAARNLEQPFDCLIVQNYQIMCSMRRSMDWTLQDNMVDGLFFCATLTSRRGSHTHLYKQEWKRPTPVRRRLSRTQALLGRTHAIQALWDSHSKGWVPMSGMKMRSLVGLSVHSASNW